MSQIIQWISNNLFSKPKDSQNKITNGSVNDNIDVTVTEQNKNSDPGLDNKSSIQKWTPDDNLWMRYNNFLETMSEIQRKKHSENKLISQSKHLIVQYKMESASDDITSKMNALQTKQQLISVETQLKRVQDAIKQLESMDGKILEEYENYLNSAREFLYSRGLDSFVDINEILCSTNLFVLMKKTLDSYYSTKNHGEEKLKQIAQITTYFEPGKIQNLSQITDKEFQTKRKELLKSVAHLHITDDLEKSFNPRILGNPRIEETVLHYKIQDSVDNTISLINNSQALIENSAPIVEELQMIEDSNKISVSPNIEIIEDNQINQQT